MKRCPQCRTTYTDDTLKFCLADGSVLEDAAEQETLARPGVRVDIDSPPGTMVVPGQVRQETKGSGNTVIKIVIAVVVLGALALLLAGGAGALYFISSGGTATVAQTKPTATPTSTPVATPELEPSTSPTLDPEQERLKRELANVMKKLEEELNSNSSSSPSDKESLDGQPSARVNSPKDGFLAMREEPDANSSMLAKIPHGSTVALENCEKQKTTISGRSGRWCMVTYGDETGWVFDAWLIYNQ